MSDERWIEIQYQILACRIYNNFKNFPEATEFLRTLSKLGGNNSPMECDRMLANCLTRLQLPYIKEAIIVCIQHGVNLNRLAKIYGKERSNLYQLKPRLDLETPYPPIFTEEDRTQMIYIIDGYHKIGGVII